LIGASVWIASIRAASLALWYALQIRVLDQRRVALVTAEERERAPVVRRRLLKSVEAKRAVASGLQIANGPHIAGLRVVVTHDGGELVRFVRKERLERLTDSKVEVAPLSLEDRAVRGLLRERMAEREAVSGLLDDELGCDQFFHTAQQGGFFDSQDVLEDGQIEAPPRNRRQRERLSR